MFFSVIQILALLLIIRLLIYVVQTNIRKRGTRLLPNEQVLLMADGFGLTILTNKTIIGGAVAGRPTSTVGRMVLSDKRLIVSSNQGVVLLLTTEKSGSARSVGPKRLVVLGTYAGADVRLEITVTDQGNWAKMINERFQTERFQIKALP